MKKILNIRRMCFLLVFVAAAILLCSCAQPEFDNSKIRLLDGSVTKSGDDLTIGVLFDYDGGAYILNAIDYGNDDIISGQTTGVNARLGMITTDNAATAHIVYHMKADVDPSDFKLEIKYCYNSKNSSDKKAVTMPVSDIGDGTGDETNVSNADNTGLITLHVSPANGTVELLP